MGASHVGLLFLPPLLEVPESTQWGVDWSQAEQAIWGKERVGQMRAHRPRRPELTPMQRGSHRSQAWSEGQVLVQGSPKRRSRNNVCKAAFITGLGSCQESDSLGGTTTIAWEYKGFAARRLRARHPRALIRRSGESETSPGAPCCSLLVGGGRGAGEVQHPSYALRWAGPSSRGLTARASRKQGNARGLPWSR